MDLNQMVVSISLVFVVETKIRIVIVIENIKEWTDTKKLTGKSIRNRSELEPATLCLSNWAESGLSDHPKFILNEWDLLFSRQIILSMVYQAKHPPLFIIVWLSFSLRPKFESVTACFYYLTVYFPPTLASAAELVSCLSSSSSKEITNLFLCSSKELP